MDSPLKGNNLKILFVCSAREWGGNEKWSTMAMNELEKQGHSVSILLRNPLLGKKFGKPWLFAPFITAFDPFTFLITFFILLFKRPDAIVSTKKAEYFVLGVLSRLFRIRHILRLGIVRDLDSGWRRFVYTRLNEGIIVNAKRTKDNFLKYDFVDQDRIKLIYNGIPEIKTGSVPERKDSRLNIVSVGTLTPRKGFHLLFDALASLPEDVRKGIRLTIVGSGLMKAELNKQIKDLKLEDSVDMAGFQSDPVPFLQTADIFALVSENEGISNALLEGMMLGLPVLTTLSGGTEEFLVDNKNGFAVEREAVAIARRMEELYGRRAELPAIGAAGTETVKEFFSLSRMGREVEAFLETPRD
ncbi:glycosyltransferase [Oceanispirochaeta sp. M1]|nr:glycosyltransferase [Oceanispirochaeta sp. M1]